MKFCPFCGKKINLNIKFCNYCGKNLKNEKHIREHPKPTSSKSKNSRLPVFLIIIFIGFISLIVVFLNQRSISLGNEDVELLLAEETVKDISQQINEIKTVEEKRREGYSLDEKPFDNRNYAYDERHKDFRLVCTNPCPVSKQVLDQEDAAIEHAIRITRGLTQSDIDKNLLPFEVHASKDDVCPRLKGALAYQSSFTDGNGYSRGKLCFFFDEINYNRDKFPYSTSIHEVMHLFQVNKLPPYTGGSRALWEGLSEMLESFFLKGSGRDSFCWRGNNWWKETQYYNPNDPHGTGRELFFELCNQYGFDYDNLPALFRELEKRDVDEKGFVDIINNIVGSDTSYLFRNAGVI